LAHEVGTIAAGGAFPHAPIMPHAIVLDVHAADAQVVLETAAAHIARVHGLDSAILHRALARRDAAAPTAVGFGFTIPHARIGRIHGPLTLFRRTHKPVGFGAPDGEPVRNFYVIVVLTEADVQAHHLLASVAATFADRKFRSRLSCSTTALHVEEAFRRAG
jgi:PTS system nitrogen regulatory IIA component